MRRLWKLMLVNRDRVGLSWRPQLAAGIFTNLDRIDVVEVIADDYFDVLSKARALRTLRAQVPVVLHGISQGLSSTVLASERRLAKMARLVELVEPESWSEHLAFVRAGDLEIGHLAAPPRNASTVAGTWENLELARRVVGMTPMVENIATLIDPPASTMTEANWVRRIIDASGSELLLDLHNLYANAHNFDYETSAFLDQIPLEKVGAVHIAGGRMTDRGTSRILDDHLHDVPDPVYELLTELAARTPRSLTVILERDGEFPPMAHLLRQLDRARKALSVGRLRRAA